MEQIETRKITKIIYNGCAKGGMFGYFGAQEYRVAIENEDYFRTVHVPVAEMKAKGLTGRFDHKKRVLEWLKTSEGHKYLLGLIDEPYFKRSWL